MFFYDATEGGVRPDMYMPPNGVTTVVDAGSAGTANFDAFYRTVICASKVRIKAFFDRVAAGPNLVTRKL
ncbi:metallo-dependent hydrolase [Salmonella sp. NCTC 11881]|nr:metallo-dependent hydrolase [Salmonella sp. NCTC 11881]